jgi:hypothetical protein
MKRQFGARRAFTSTRHVDLTFELVDNIEDLELMELVLEEDEEVKRVVDVKIAVERLVQEHFQFPH